MSESKKELTTEEKSGDPIREAELDLLKENEALRKALAAEQKKTEELSKALDKKEGAASEEEARSARIQAENEEIVEFTLPRVPGEANARVVNVSGRQFTVMRGVPVKMPRFVAKELQNSLRAEEEVYERQVQLASAQ